jgi:hypothetical protein
MKHYQMEPELTQALKAKAEKYGLKFDATEKETFDIDNTFCEVDMVCIEFPERDGVLHEVMIEVEPSGGYYFLQLATRREGEPDQDTDIVWQDGMDESAEVVCATQDFIENINNPPSR